MHLIQQLEKELGKANLPVVHVGDSVDVHYLIKEGDKERVQLFIGTIIAVKGRGMARSIIVRRIVQSEGVERTFPLHSPRVKDVVVTRRGQVRRAKLFYMRHRTGKENRLKEILGDKLRRDEAYDERAAANDSEAPVSAAHASSPEPVKV